MFSGEPCWSVDRRTLQVTERFSPHDRKLELLPKCSQHLPPPLCASKELMPSFWKTKIHVSRQPNICEFFDP